MTAGSSSGALNRLANETTFTPLPEPAAPGDLSAAARSGTYPGTSDAVLLTEYLLPSSRTKIFATGVTRSGLTVTWSVFTPCLFTSSRMIFPAWSLPTQHISAAQCPIPVSAIDSLTASPPTFSVILSATFRPALSRLFFVMQSTTDCPTHSTWGPPSSQGAELSITKCFSAILSSVIPVFRTGSRSSSVPAP